MKLGNCTDKICELAKTQVAMICKDDADDCLSKYFTQKCADDDATCKAAREKVAAVCKQQSSPCVDKYYDMDCLPVDKFTINPAQIEAANYTLEGCRGQSSHELQKSGPNENPIQKQEIQDKNKTNGYFLVGGGYLHPFNNGVETEEKDYSSSQGGGRYADQLSEFTSSDFTDGFKVFVGGGKRGSLFFGESVLDGQIIFSERIVDKEGDTAELYDVEGNSVFGGKADAHSSKLLSAKARLGIHGGRINLPSISIFGGIGIGWRWDKFYKEDLGVAVDEERLGLVSELGMRLSLSSFFSDDFHLGAVYQHPIMEDQTQGEVETNQSGGTGWYRATPILSLELMYLLKL